MTSSSCTSPTPCTSVPASSSARTVSWWPWRLPSAADTCCLRPLARSDWRRARAATGRCPRACPWLPRGVRSSPGGAPWDCRHEPDSGHSRGACATTRRRPWHRPERTGRRFLFAAARPRPSGHASSRSHGPAATAEQRRGQLRARVYPPQLPQSVLRQLFQILEGSAFRKFRRGHRPLPSMSPGVRVSRAGSQGF